KLRKDRSGLDLHVVSNLEDGLEPGLWGIREPRGGGLIEDFSLIDFVLVPGVAFSREGGRLGYGGGFYDRLLVEKRRDASAVAAAFSVQIVEEVPIEENDIFVDGIVTEEAEYFRNRENS
ncbi:MAG TPA: 5-formyltetrahydrofolate cyclo-ligase, partial [Burkholderiales bacterium]|nr:5-formyltetrahydrofolate cyclo-ligase [Burkholderiales bacterium]